MSSEVHACPICGRSMHPIDLAGIGPMPAPPNWAPFSHHARACLMCRCVELHAYWQIEGEA